MNLVIFGRCVPVSMNLGQLEPGSYTGIRYYFIPFISFLNFFVQYVYFFFFDDSTV
jgi:hypothetical protein